MRDGVLIECAGYELKHVVPLAENYAFFVYRESHHPSNKRCDLCTVAPFDGSYYAFPGCVIGFEDVRQVRLSESAPAPEFRDQGGESSGWRLEIGDWV
jgi:hypothetical protein